ncbi:MAG: response regulator [Planctomycetes bacterium]|nr:response regulator [Planctomycetota bacterium]
MIATQAVRTKPFVSAKPKLVSREATPRPWQQCTSAPRVLIVEDDLDVHEGWSVFLQYHGYEVMSARDGLQGLESLDVEEPDIMLLDLGLPGVDGMEVLRRMRASGNETPVVVITAYSSVQTDLAVRDMGADAVLAKPINQNTLIPVIEELLGS